VELVFLPTKTCANKLAPYSELIIFIEYEDNRHHFMQHTQGNTIFYSTHAIFDKGLFPKYTNSYVKEHKLYNKLLDETRPEIELLTPNSSEKDGSALVPISHIPIPLIQNNPSTGSLSSSLSYKSTFSPPTPEPKKPKVEIEKTNDVDSDIEMQPSSL